MHLERRFTRAKLRQAFDQDHGYDCPFYSCTQSAPLVLSLTRYMQSSLKLDKLDEAYPEAASLHGIARHDLRELSNQM